MFGHTLPLVYTGDTLEASKNVKITATIRGVKLSYSGLNRLYLYKPKGGMIDLVDEFTRLSPGEGDDMQSLFYHKLEYLLKTFNGHADRLIR
jgi:hypothetical protein